MERIDKYIQQQKEIKPSPNLECKIMERIEGIDNQKSSIRIDKIPFWQKAAVAASIAIAIMTGIGLGNSMVSKTSPNNVSLLINDKYIEQLYTYIENE